MKPINIFIDGILFVDITLKRDKLDERLFTIDLYRKEEYIACYSPEQHILHYMSTNKETGEKTYWLASKKGWEY